MTVAKPRISVGLPVYNGEAHLEAAIESLLEQDFREFELIITDNASTDRTPEICRRYLRRDRRIRYYRNSRNLGAAGNYNRAFRLARAPLFKWAPHDDLCAPSYLRRCVETLEQAGPEVVLCYPKTLLINSAGGTVGEYEDNLEIRDTHALQRLAHLLQNDKSWCHPVVGAIRTEALRSTRLIGSYAGSDHVLLAELALLGQFWELPERLFLRRIEGGASPSLHSNTTPEERAAWFDTRKANQVAMPRTRLLWEHARAIHRAQLSWRDRWACYRLLRNTPFASYWARPAITEEFARAVRKACWERYILNGVQDARRHYLPHRAWAFMSGVKRQDWARIALAMSPPSPDTHFALLEFVASSLSQRSDRQSQEILDEWLGSSAEPRRLAAASALSRQNGRVCSPHA